MKMSRAGASPAFPQGAVSEKAASRLAFEPAGIAVGRNAPDKNIDNLPQEMMAEEKKTGDAVKTKSKPAVKEDNIFTDIEFSPGPGNLDEITEKETPPPVHKKNRIWMVAIWTILVIVVVPAIVYFFVFPQLGERYLKVGEHGVRVVLNVFGVSQPMEGQSVAGLVKLQDIRQRFLDNYIMGNKIRIVEGFAVNQADYSVARILIKGTILDAYAVVKGERVIYAGNVLTDEELANLSEEEISRRLTLPSGRDNLNERVMPNGRIPFMIVFTNEPPGAIKTTVRTVNAERLL